MPINIQIYMERHFEYNSIRFERIKKNKIFKRESKNQARKKSE